VAEADRKRWNRRYSERLAQRDYTFEPSRWLVEIADQLRPPHRDARALDIACGGGRNAIWLAERTWAVDAWDLSDVGLAILSRELDARAARGAPLEVYPQQLDLDEAAIPQGVYDLVLNIMFLDRRLWPPLVAALRPGGLLVFQTFVDAPGGRTSEVSPEHLLQPGELRTAFEALGLETVTYDEAGERATARLLARKPEHADGP
jgi:tellurite methyltransferase